jgi:hypothetical protein
MCDEEVYYMKVRDALAEALIVTGTAPNNKWDTYKQFLMEGHTAQELEAMKVSDFTQESLEQISVIVELEALLEFEVYPEVEIEDTFIQEFYRDPEMTVEQACKKLATYMHDNKYEWLV